MIKDRKIMKPYVIKFTDEQIKAINAAFPDGSMALSEKMRVLLANALINRGIDWPSTPKHGGKRTGSGRKSAQ